MEASGGGLKRAGSLNRGSEAAQKATRKSSIDKAPTKDSVRRSSSLNDLTRHEEIVRLRNDISNARAGVNHPPPHSTSSSRRRSISGVTTDKEFAKMAIGNDQPNINSTQERIFPGSTNTTTGSLLHNKTHATRSKNSSNPTGGLLFKADITGLISLSPKNYSQTVKRKTKPPRSRTEPLTATKAFHLRK